MTKEVLTKENIQKDVLAYVKRIADAKGSYLLDIGVYSMILLILLACAGAWQIALPFALVPIISFLRYIPWWRAAREERGEASQGEFTIVREKLSHIAEETIYEPRYLGRYTRNMHSVRFLYFPCGQWRIQPRNYTWSKTFYMSGQGVENTSLVGDEFYIAIVNSTQEICAVYNTKFFTYTDND